MPSTKYQKGIVARINLKNMNHKIKSVMKRIRYLSKVYLQSLAVFLCVVQLLIEFVLIWHIFESSQ